MTGKYLIADETHLDRTSLIRNLTFDPLSGFTDPHEAAERMPDGWTILYAPGQEVPA